jgi:hypothetical protein
MAILDLFSVILLVCSFQAKIDGYYVGDQGTFTQMKDMFGAQQFSSTNNSDFIILATGNGIVGKVAQDKTFRVLEFLDLLAPDFVRLLQDVIDFETDVDNPFNFQIDNFTVNTDTNEFEIGTGVYDSIELIPSFLTLRDLTVIIRISVDFQYSSFTERFRFNGLAVAGVWRLASVGGLDFKISKFEDEWYFRGAPESGSLDVGKFAQDIATAILPSGGLEQSLKNAGLDKFTIEDARFIGVKNSLGFAIGLSGSPTIEGWGQFRGHVMVHRYAQRPWQEKATVVTLGIAFPSYRLSDLVQKVADIDITDIPFLGTLTVPEVGLIVSSGAVYPNLVPEVMDGILKNVQPILRGVAIAVGIPIVSGQPAVQFILRLAPKDIRFSIIDPGASLTLTNLLDVIIPDFDLSDLSLPPGVSDLLNLRLYGFEYQHQSKSVTVELRFGEQLVLIPDAVTILNPTIMFNVTLKKPRRKIIEANGAWKLGSAKFPVELKPAPLPPISPINKPRISGDKPVTARGFQLTAKFDDINIADIIDEFDVEFLPPELQDVLTQASLINFSIKEPYISIPIGTGSKGFLLHLAGRPQIGDWSQLKLNALLSKTAGKANLALGVEFARIGFADLIQQLTGADVSWISLLDQSLQCAIVISPKTMDGVALEGEVLSSIPIQRGLSIVGLFSFPDDCVGDDFCEFMKAALGTGATMQLRSTISSLKQFTFAATVNDIRLGEELLLTNAGLEFMIGVETSIGLVASLRLISPPITFQGAIRMGLQGLELEMAMVGIWEQAFGIEWLAFGNALLAIALKPGVPVVGFAIGGELRLGKLNTGKEIIMAVYLGIDPVMPRRNYFYGSVNKASLGALLDAFEWSVDLPKVLRESGFPNGLLVSFAYDHIEVPGHVIPAGFRLNGTLNILGFTVTCDIIIDIPRRIKIDIHASPLNLAGGLLKLYKSRDQSSLGPMFYADIKIVPPSVEVKASGYASLVYGIVECETTLEISNTEFQLRMSGRFFLFDAELRVYANYGSLESAAFQVYGKLSTAWMEELEKRVVNAIDEAQKAATAKISEAQGKVNSAQSSYDAAVRTLQQKQRDVENKNKDFDRAIANLQKKQNNVHRLCRLRTCHKVCMGCPSWRSCCTRWWGRCIGCPGWNSCCWRAPDLICEAANLGCKALRAIAFAALELAKKVVDGSRWTLDVAKGVLKAAEVIVDNNRWPLDAAIGILEGVKWTVSAATEAAKFIVRLGLGGIIGLRKIEFDVKIGLVSEGHFMGNIEVSFLRKSYVTISFELRLKSVKDMILDLIDMIFPGISGRDRREVETRMKRAFPDFSRKHYFPEIYRPGSYRPQQSRAGRKRPIAVPTSNDKFRRASAYDDENSVGSEVPSHETGTVVDVLAAVNKSEQMYHEMLQNSSLQNETIAALLANVSKSEELYEQLLQTFSVVDDEEGLGPDPDEVVAEATYLKERMVSSQDYRPREEEEDDNEFQLPSLDPCPLEGEVGDVCGTANDLAQLLYEVPNAIEGEYEEWKNSVHSYSLTKTGTDLAWEEVQNTTNESEQERETVYQVKETLDVTANEGTILSQEERTRIDNRISMEEKDVQVTEALRNDMKEANQSVRDHLVKQNLEVMEVIKSTFMHVVQKKTGKSLDEYLNALFSCLAVPYQGIASEDATALEVLEILSSLHEKFDGLLDMTLVSAKKVVDDINTKLEELKEKKVFCK